MPWYNGPMNPARRFEITLDMVLEATRNRMNRISVQGEARQELKRYNIMSVVLKEVGPAGGNADVRLYGSHCQLELYIKEIYCKGDPLEAAYHITRIVPYTGAAQQATL